MNRTWISHGSWQSCGRKTGVGAGRWVGWLANWQEGERAGLCWCLLLGSAAQSRVKHKDRRQRSGQLRRWAGLGCDHRHWECEDLLKEIEEGGVRRWDVAASADSCWCNKEKRREIFPPAFLSCLSEEAGCRKSQDCVTVPGLCSSDYY